MKQEIYDKVMCEKFLEFFNITKNILADRSTSEWLKSLDDNELNYLNKIISKFDSDDFDPLGEIESDLILLCHILFSYEYGLDVSCLDSDNCFNDKEFSHGEELYSNLCILVGCETMRRKGIIEITEKLKISSLRFSDSYVKLTENGKKIVKEIKSGQNILHQIINLMELRN